MNKLKSLVIAAGCPLALVALGGTIALTLQPAAQAWPPPIPVSPAFTYQGVLKSGGAPYNGTADVQFSMWDQVTGGFMIAGPAQANGLVITDGQFTAQVNFGTAEFYGLERWLQIDVHTPSSGGTGPWQPLSFRQRFAPVPYALHALSIGGVQPSAVAFSNTTNSFAGEALSIDGGTLHVDAANNRVGIGTTTPQAGLEVVGAGYPGAFVQTNSNGGNGDSGMRMGRDGGTYWHMFNSSATDSFMLRNGGFGPVLTALQNGNVGLGTDIPTERLSVVSGATDIMRLWGPGAFGWDARLRFEDNVGNVYLHNDIDGGLIINTNGGLGGRLALTGGKVGIGTTAPTGGQLHVANPTGDAIFAESAVNGGRGVFGFASAGVLSYGVYGQSNGSDGIGVYGTGTTRGGFFTTAAGSGHGVKGNVTGATGFGSGVFGESAASQGAGVTGLSTATTALSYGGVFQAVGNIGQGVYGFASHTTGTNIGVHGQTASPANGWGVFATGRLGATGTKPFRIDHPEDPANKYLLHYSAESNEVINFYSGKVTLNGAGEAVVDLPSYFSKINIDPRYTLTAIGAAMPNLHIADEISEAMLAAEGPCWFRIAGGAPGAKVSWRVEAVRHDAWVRAYGAPVEVDKPEHERGHYQHPELYGQPASAALNAGVAEVFKNHSAPVEPLPINREPAKPTQTRP